MANEKTLEVILQLKDELSKKLSDANLKMNNFGNAMSKAVKIAAGAFAANKVLSFTEECLDAFAQQETAMRKLQTALSNTGHSWESSSAQVNEYLNSVKETTAFSNNEATEALQEMLVYTKDLSKATDGTRLAMNMAASGMFDLNTAVRYVGMAMEGNVEILGRYIPELRASSNENLDSMSSAEKATYALNLLQQKFGGMASGELETYAGQMKKLGNTLNEVKETIGASVIKWLNLTDVTKFWTDQLDRLLPKLNAFSPGMKQLASDLKETSDKINALQKNGQFKWDTAKVTELESQRVALIQLMHKLQETELGARAEQNYGAETGPLTAAEAETSFLREQYDERLQYKADYLSDSALLSESGSQGEFEDQLWLTQQLQGLEYSQLREKNKTAAEKVKIAAAAAQAEANIVAQLYAYQATAAMNIARIFTAAAQITGSSWLNAAGIIIKGISQVMATVSKLKAIASPNPFDKAMAIIEIAAIAFETAAALKALEDSKKQLSDLSVEQFNRDIPQAAEGADIVRGGLIRVHDDERVMPARVNPLGSSGMALAGANIYIDISIAEAKLNSPSNIADFKEELYRDIGFLTDRLIGRPR